MLRPVCHPVSLASSAGGLLRGNVGILRRDICWSNRSNMSHKKHILNLANVTSTFDLPIFAVGDVNIRVDLPTNLAVVQFIGLLDVRGLKYCVVGPVHEGCLDIFVSRDIMPLPCAIISVVNQSENFLLH
jgi:hypothetical protein